MLLCVHLTLFGALRRLCSLTVYILGTFIFILFVDINVMYSPEIINFFSWSTELSMKFVLLINLKFLTVAHSFFLNITQHENIFADKYENAN